MKAKLNSTSLDNRNAQQGSCALDFLLEKNIKDPSTGESDNVHFLCDLQDCVSPTNTSGSCFSTAPL